MSFYTTTYRISYQKFNPSFQRRITNSGTLRREGIFPVHTNSERGIQGTRFLSEADVLIAAFGTHALGMKLFDTPMTPKESKMVAIQAAKRGWLCQVGGFLGKRQCKIVKVGSFHQDNYTASHIDEITDAMKKISFSKLWDKPRPTKTIIELTNIRIDIQPEAEDGQFQNIQVQINRRRRNASDSTSITDVLLDLNLQYAKNEAHQKHVLRKFWHAMNLSLRTGCIYKLVLE